MPKIKIEKVKHEDKVSAGGKNYTRCSILTINTKGEEVWISGFGNNTTKSFTKGQTVELTITPSESNGKTYYNFEEPAERNMFVELDEIKATLRRILIEIGNHTTQSVKTLPQAKSDPVQSQEMTVEEIEASFGEKPVDDTPDFLK